MVDPNRGMAEAMRRRKAMVAEWAELGHPNTPCVGHGYPNADCPAPEVHRQVFPPQQVVPKVTAFSETAIMWHVMTGNLAGAREIVSGMTGPERTEFEEKLTMIASWLWALA